MSLKIEAYELPPIGTNCFLVSNMETSEAAVFDAPLNAAITVEKQLATRGLKLTGCYLTHAHWDHTLDGWRFNEMQVPCFGHADDRFLYEEPENMAAFSMPGLEMRPVRISQWLEDRERIELLGETVEIRHVPGHSPGSILFWFQQSQFAVSGDVVFRGGVGRTDFPGCSFEQLEASIRTSVFTLPDGTRLLPGHGPETTVGWEKENNPFVSA